MINVDQIIKRTINDFQNNKNKFSKLDYIDIEKYHLLHTKPLVPLDIRVDSKLFTEQIEIYKNYFQIWGQDYKQSFRYGIPLVNLTGKINFDHDPINGSLHIWNQKNPDIPYIESDFRIPTPIMDISSLRSLNVFNNHWCRSNILKWYNGSEFKPHIDTVLPSPWFRLWGTTDSKNIELIFYNENNEIIEIDPIESGRIYLIDTTLVHSAKCINDVAYQYFLSVLPSAYDILLKLR